MSLPVTNSLALHLAADAIVGLSDGDPVASWADISGNGNHAVQATADRQPTYELDGLNTLPVVLFDGGDSLESAENTLGEQDELTVFAVVKVDDSTTTSQAFVSASSDHRYGTASDWFSIMLLSSRFRTVMTSTAEQAAQLFGDTDWHIHTLRWSSGSPGEYSYWVDDILESPGLTSTTQDFSNRVEIGARTHNNNLLVGLIGPVAEVIVYDRSLDETERAAVEDYLYNKWFVEPPAEVVIERALSWGAAAAVSSVRDLAWGVRTVFDTDRVLSWGIRTPVETERGAAWDVRTLVALSRALLWNTESFYTPSRIVVATLSMRDAPTAALTLRQAPEAALRMRRSLEMEIT